MRGELRRQALHAPPPADPGLPALLELLRAEIEQAGPITFAQYMQRALYEPGLGYYARSGERTGRAGDFLTAPELHPVFGHTLARAIDEMWRTLGQPERFVVREYGAGNGALAAALLEGLALMDSPLLPRLRYQPVDLPAQQAALAERLRAAGRADLLEPPDGQLVGCVLANEYLDALPVQRVVMRRNRLRELYVGWSDGRLVELEGEPSSPALADWFARAGIELADGLRAQVNLAMLDWLTEVSAELERGYVLIFDYGAEPAELYGAGRATGTLRAFRAQHVSSDVLGGVGRQDLTAHVDLGALERGAREAGLDVLGRTTQAAFLLGSGLEQVMNAERQRQAESWQGLLTLRSAVARLIDPRALGGYAAVVLGRGVDDESRLSGLAYRPPGRE